MAMRTAIGPLALGILLTNVSADAQQPAAASPARTPFPSLRDATTEEWKPELLLPNDLTDPPKNYPQSPGGTCVGICAVTYAMWACPKSHGYQSPEGCAVRIIHSLLKSDAGRYPSHPLPSHIRLGTEKVPIEDPRALVRLAEIIQQALQPGGGLPKSRETILEIAGSLARDPLRLRTLSDLERLVDENGGRAVVIAAEFAPDFSRMSGHAIVVASEDGRLGAFDPNARRGANDAGGGKLAPLEIDAPRGLLRSIAYSAILPDGTASTRRFTALLPVSSVATPDRLRALPPLR